MRRMRRSRAPASPLPLHWPRRTTGGRRSRATFLHPAPLTSITGDPSEDDCLVSYQEVACSFIRGACHGGGGAACVRHFCSPIDGANKHSASLSDGGSMAPE